MKGKTCIVTGVTSGIGLETALALARLGAEVVGVGRNVGRCASAAKRIREESGNTSVRIETADLGSQAEVLALAARIADTCDRIDVLVNNAGTAPFRRQETIDGIETQFAVNYLAPFLLTHELLPLLLRSGEARIANVCSESHWFGRIHWRNLQLRHWYNGLAAYGQSKLALVMFTYEFSRRFQGAGKPAIYAVDPGLVVTDIGMKAAGRLVGFLWRIRRRAGVTPRIGAATSIHVATSPDAAGRSGLYWRDCRPTRSSRRSYDEEAASRLWDLSCDLCGTEWG